MGVNFYDLVMILDIIGNNGFGLLICVFFVE